jgi:hypothetical protein
MAALQLGIISVGRIPSEISYITNASDSVDRSVYTFSGQSIGPASNDRVVIVTIGSRVNASTTLSGVTIGGVTATEIAYAQNVHAGGTEHCAIYAAKITSGTTAEIVVTFTGPSLRCAIGVFAKTGSTGVSSFDTDTDITDTSGEFGVSVDVPDNGTVLCAAFCGASGSTSWTFSGVTEDFDIQPEIAANALASGHDNYVTGQTVNLTATATSTPLDGAVAIATWG